MHTRIRTPDTIVVHVGVTIALSWIGLIRERLLKSELQC